LKATPRGKRHVRVCTGTACFATTAGAHVGALRDGLGCELGARSADGSVSLAETPCLGFCHSAPAVRDGDVVDAGPGVVERVLAGTPRAAREPTPRSALVEPVLLALGDAWGGLSRAVATLTPAELLDEVKAAGIRERGGAGAAAGETWESARDGEGELPIIVADGDEAQTGSYVDKLLMEEHPDLLLEGMALAAYAIGARHGIVVTPAQYPRSKPTLEWAAAVARRAGLLGQSVLGSEFSFEVTIVEGASLAREVGALRATAVLHTVETLCNLPVVARRGAAHYARLSPASETCGTKLVCFNERFARPGVYEVQFGTTTRELCEELAGGLRDGRAIQALQIGGPPGAILPGALLDTRLDFDELAAVGCTLGHGGIVAFDETMDMHALAEHLRRLGAGA